MRLALPTVSIRLAWLDVPRLAASACVAGHIWRSELAKHGRRKAAVNANSWPCMANAARGPLPLDALRSPDMIIVKTFNKKSTAEAGERGYRRSALAGLSVDLILNSLKFTSIVSHSGRLMRPLYICPFNIKKTV